MESERVRGLHERVMGLPLRLSFSEIKQGDGRLKGASAAAATSETVSRYFKIIGKDFARTNE